LEYRAIYAKGLPNSVRAVLAGVERETGIPVAEFRRRGRMARASAKARQLAIVRLRAETKLSLQALAAVFGIGSQQSVWRIAQRARRPI
jgi:chromosomal replication initiation ATPase DnaA